MNDRANLIGLYDVFERNDASLKATLINNVQLNVSMDNIHEFTIHYAEFANKLTLAYNNNILLKHDVYDTELSNSVLLYSKFVTVIRDFSMFIDLHKQFLLNYGVKNVDRVMCLVYNKFNCEVHFIDRMIKKLINECVNNNDNIDKIFDLIISADTDISSLKNYLMSDSDIKSNNWDNKFIKLAMEISTWSKDPSTKVGAIAVSPNNSVVLSQGYNGFPRGINDDYRLHIKEMKYDLIAHAEMNMIYNSTYNGVSLKDSTVYIYGLPCCSQCANALIQCGVKRIVYYVNSPNKIKWKVSSEKAIQKFKSVNIEVDELTSIN